MKISPIQINKINSYSFGLKFGSVQNKSNTPDIDTFEYESNDLPPEQQARLLYQINRRIDNLNSKLHNLRKTNPYYYEKQKSNFLALIEDAKRRKEELISRFNPNTQFLLDTDRAIRSMKAIVSKRPEIIPVKCLTKIDEPKYSELWNNEDFFVQTKTSIGDFLDKSYILNRDNYNKLSNFANMTYSQFIRQYGYNKADLYRYIQDGLIEQVTLYNWTKDTDVPIFLIDPNTTINQNGIERHKKLHTLVKESPYINKTILSGKYLENLGFGTEEDIIQGIRTRHVAGQVYNRMTKDGVKPEARVMFELFPSQQYLCKLRDENPNLQTPFEFAKSAEMSVTDVEDAILNEELKIIPHYIYPDDSNRILLNLKNPQNIKFLNRKKFEYALIKGQSDENTPLNTKLCLQLCPKTKQTAESVRRQFHEAEYILKNAEGHILSYAEAKKINHFSNQLWTQENIDEYNFAEERVNKALEKYYANGIDAVKDEDIKKLIITMV